MICGLSILAKGTLDEKLDRKYFLTNNVTLLMGTFSTRAVLFRSFDVDNTGFITQAQLEALITSVSSQLDPECPEKHSSMGVWCRTPLPPPLPPLPPLCNFSQSVQSGVVGTDPLGGRVISVSVFVAQVFAHLCITTGRLSLEQFRQAVIAEPRLIVSLSLCTPPLAAP